MDDLNSAESSSGWPTLLSRRLRSWARGLKALGIPRLWRSLTQGSCRRRLGILFLAVWVSPLPSSADGSAVADAESGSAGHPTAGPEVGPVAAEAAMGEEISKSDLILPEKPPVSPFSPQDHARSLELGRRLRAEKNYNMARSILAAMIETDVPPELQEEAMLELAAVAEDQFEWQRALQVYAQYTERFPESKRVPTILLRQGLVYRQMGASNLALSKFYAVLNSAIALPMEDVKDYERVVLQAQAEIAETHFLQGAYAEASDLFRRLIRLSSPQLNVAAIRYKLLQCLSAVGDLEQVVSEAYLFLAQHRGAKEEPEVRFLLSGALKDLGRNQESLRQVLQLLSSQYDPSAKNAANWIAWQRRTGNQIANQLYAEGDFVSALEIYLGLAALDPSLAWQVPIYYQVGLIYERLGQPQRAHETYVRVLSREAELGGQATASLKSLMDMVRWRKGFINWQGSTEQQKSDLGIKPPVPPPVP